MAIAQIMTHFRNTMWLLPNVNPRISITWKDRPQKMHHSLVPQSDTIRLPDFKSNTTFKASKKLYSLMLVFDACGFLTAICNVMSLLMWNNWLTSPLDHDDDVKTKTRSLFQCIFLKLQQTFLHHNIHFFQKSFFFSNEMWCYRLDSHIYEQMFSMGQLKKRSKNIYHRHNYT